MLLVDASEVVALIEVLGWVVPYTSVRHIARIRIVIHVRQIPDVCKIVASRSKGKSVPAGGIL